MTEGFGYGEGREKRRRPNAGRRREYRAALWKRQGGRCHDCGCKVQLHESSAHPSPVMVLRRLLPERDGGLFSLANLIGICRPCTAARNEQATDWEAWEGQGRAQALRAIPQRPGHERAP